MTQLESVLRRAVANLVDAGARIALVGGLAVSVRTEPRFTRDADLVVAVADDREAEHLVRQLQSDGYGVTALIEQEALRRLATVRLKPPHSADVSVIDLLFASSGIEAEIVADAEPIELLPSLTVPVARVGHLIALKVLARDDLERPQDLIDLRALLKDAAPADLELARHAITLITSRGYHRERDLARALDDLHIP